MPELSPATKVCTRCHTEKPLQAMAISGRRPSSMCKACDARRRLDYKRRRRRSDMVYVVEEACLRRFNASPGAAEARANATCTCADATCHGRIEPHHPKYWDALDVVWLCKSHHRRLHHWHAVRPSTQLAVYRSYPLTRAMLDHFLRQEVAFVERAERARRRAEVGADMPHKRGS
jgi:hypothetical protein